MLPTSTPQLHAQSAMQVGGGEMVAQCGAVTAGRRAPCPRRVVHAWPRGRAVWSRSTAAAHRHPQVWGTDQVGVAATFSVADGVGLDFSIKGEKGAARLACAG